MPTRLDPGINAHPIPAGIVLSTDEWHRLTDPLDMAGHTLEETFLVLAGRIDASYNVAHVVRELLNAGESGSSVPPKDLPATIRRIGEARHAAEHNAKQLAGEVADLRDRLEDRLPAVLTTVLEELADNAVLGICGEVTDESCQLVVDAATRAYRLALRLTEDYDMRDRDQPRPAEPVTYRVGGLADKFTVDRDRFLNDPADLLRAAYTEARATGSGPGVLRTDLPYLVWGQPITATHPLVTYLADHLGHLMPCDGTLQCKQALITNVLIDAADDLTKQGDHIASSDGTPLDRWVRRSAERLADHTAEHNLAALAGYIRNGLDHAAAVIKPAGSAT